MLQFSSERPLNLARVLLLSSLRGSSWPLQTVSFLFSHLEKKRGCRRYYYLGATLGYIFSDSDCRQVQEEGSLHGKKQMPYSIYYLMKHIALVKKTTYSRCKRNGPVDFFSSDKFQWVCQQL